MTNFSFARFVAMLRKEWLQMQRDPFTISLVVMLPLMQLFLFGFAINTNPHNLPTGILSADHSQYERTLTVALRNTGYFDIRSFTSEKQANEALADGEVLFVLEIPPNFARSVDRGDHPSVLLDADATDPVAIGNATAAIAALNAGVLNRDLPPNLKSIPVQPAFNVMVHLRYNPEQITALNIVPGLIGTILMMSTLVITTMSITREREAGTMENLLAMPVRPIEVMLGKIVPYIGLGYVQVLLIVAVSALAFQVPMRGSLLVLLAALGVFIAGNLALGITFSTVARTQQQAQQLAQFSLLPQMMLSGFMFPFQGMPAWARGVGELLPLTHILRVCRGVMLKGNGFAEIIPELWPMALFAMVMAVVAVLCYRETLD